MRNLERPKKKDLKPKNLLTHTQNTSYKGECTAFQYEVSHIAVSKSHFVRVGLGFGLSNSLKFIILDNLAQICFSILLEILIFLSQVCAEPS